LPQSSKRILCVEDNEDIRFMLITALRGAGYDVSAADSISKAAALIRAEQFDLFILDNKFGAESGVELCQTMRVICPDTPVIFYSGAAYDSDRQQALRAGASAYIIKPGLEELLKAVRRILEADNGLAGGNVN
jgi:CheY-like chemotaxis protein